MAARPALPLLLAVLLCAGPAAAYPDARVEARITPNFGALLSPPVKPSRRPHGGGWRGGRPKPAEPPRSGPLLPSLSIDCRDPKAGPRPVSDALRRLQPGGTLYIRSGAACRETVEAWRSVTIVGEAGSAFDPRPAAPPVIHAPAGQPCLLIGPQVRVEIRDLQLVSDRGGREACVDALHSDVALVRTDIRYAGDEAAVLVDGGRLLLRDARIDASGAPLGLSVQGAAIDVQHSEVRAASYGADLDLDARAPSVIDGLRLVGPGVDARGRSAGLLLRGGRGAGRLSMRGGAAEGWTTGLWFDIGAAADVAGVSVRRTRLGVMIDDADVRLTGSRIGARDSAVYIGAGRPVVDGNILYGFLGQAVAVAPGAGWSGRNQVYPRHGCDPRKVDGCQPFAKLAPDMRDDDGGWAPPAPTGRPSRR